jgi:DNA-directed RNA polymerase subunit delta
MLKDINKEELELLSYTDLTYRILKEANKPLNTPTVFKEICRLLGYNDEAYANKIGNFYTSMTLDNRFVFLDSTEWDLREKHSVKVELDDDDEVVLDDEDTEEEIEEETDIDIPLDEEEIEEELDELEDLTIVDEEEIE